MPQDYKDLQELQEAREVREPLPAARWLPYFAAGLVIGLGGAWLVYPRAPAGRDPPPPPAAERAVQAQAAKTGESGPETPVNPTAAEPKFEFYTVLPRMEVRIDDWELEPTGADERSLPTGAYYLQSGSYRHPGQAGQLRARLGALGLETHIQDVDLGENGTWHRVRAGPYHSLEELNRARSLLTRNGVRFILLREALPRAGAPEQVAP